VYFSASLFAHMCLEILEGKKWSLPRLPVCSAEAFFIIKASDVLEGIYDPSKASIASTIN
jgi:hypothetical protein